ncbi:hypothetical protein Q93_03068 [Enterococcus faecalis EnGen0065]|nr:hypothetical protein Q93_03068 [Enterococcus faecalis EnGen0065]
MGKILAVFIIIFIVDILLSISVIRENRKIQKLLKNKKQ